jgi:transposase-like protein
MRKYDDEFKREAVKKIHNGQSVASVARGLGVAESLLHNWKRQTRRRVLTRKRKSSPCAVNCAKSRWGATY